MVNAPHSAPAKRVEAVGGRPWVRAARQACLALAALLVPVPAALAQPASPAAIRGGDTRATAIDFPEARAPATARLPGDGSDLVPDPLVRIGILGNGLRYAIESRPLPAGQVSVRMRVAVGAVHERDGEQGFAHLVEHMAFNGSARVPEGEMVARLERLGAAFGRDVNATVSDTETVFRFDIPSRDGAGPREALGLLREIATHLAFDPPAVEREKAVVLAEIHQAGTAARLARDRADIAATPADLAARRRAVGEIPTVAAATAGRLADFYRTWYRPERTVVVLSGDLDPEAAEAALRALFADWRSPPGPRPSPPDNGTWPDGTQTRAVVEPDPGLEPAVTVRFLHAEEADRGRLDTAARQAWWARTRTLEQIVQARLDRAVAARPGIAREASVQFTRAANGWEFSLTGRPSTPDWSGTLDLLATELKAAVDRGLSQDELLVAREARSASLGTAAAADATRPAPVRADQLMGELARVEVSTTAADRQARFDADAARWTAPDLQRVLAGWSGAVRPVIVLQGPLGATPAEAPAIAARWDRAWAAPLPGALADRPAWTRPSLPLTLPVPPGRPAGRAERTDPRPHTIIRYENGVTLAVLATDMSRGQVEVRITLAGGALLLPADEAGLAALTAAAWQDGTVAGLARPDLATALAGTGARPATVEILPLETRLSAAVPAGALHSQLEVMLAQITRPGLEPAGAARAAVRIGQGLAVAAASADGLARLHTPSLVMRGSPRFAPPDPAALTDAGPARLRAGTAHLGRILDTAPMTVTIVGDVAVDDAIAAVGRTLGALPARAAALPVTDRREVRNWRPGRPGHTRLHHAGSASQAIILVSFATPGERDARTARALTLLAGLVQLRLTARLREADGLSYAPAAGWSAVSPAADFGRLAIQVPVHPDRLAQAEAAIAAVLGDLNRAGPDADEIVRARAPLLEARRRARQTNAHWVSRLARTGLAPAPGLEGPGLMELDASYEADLMALDAGALRTLAQRYLVMDRAVRMTVLPRPDQAGAGGPAG